SFAGKAKMPSAFPRWLRVRLWATGKRRSWVRTPEKSSARGELTEAIGTERTDGRKTRNLVYDTRGNPAIDAPSHGSGKDRGNLAHGPVPRGNSGFRGFNSGADFVLGPPEPGARAHQKSLSESVLRSMTRSSDSLPSYTTSFAGVPFFRFRNISICTADKSAHGPAPPKESFSVSSSPKLFCL